MAKRQIKSKNETPDKENLPEKATAKRPNLAMTKRGFEPTTIEEAYRLAQALSESGMVPDYYRGKPRDCLVAIDLAARLGSSWLAIMQHVYSVHGRIGMDAALVTSLVNQSGLFVDPLEYEVKGDVKDKKNFRIRAYATRKSTGTVLYGPWIDWDLVEAEGWNQDKQMRNGGGIIKSKWNTMSEQMFHYRAAAWFQRRHCPEVSMGMLTTDEAAEIGPKQVESKVVESGVTALKERLAEREKAQNGGNGEDETDRQIEDAIVDSDEPEPVDPDERPEEVNEKIEQEKQKLAAAGSGSKKSNLF
jgi:hypothetical protein